MFAVLAVDRALPKPGTFERVWDAMDNEGILKKTLMGNPDAFTMEGIKFFGRPKPDVIQKMGLDLPPLLW